MTKTWYAIRTKRGGLLMDNDYNVPMLFRTKDSALEVKDTDKGEKVVKVVLFEIRTVKRKATQCFPSEGGVTR